MSSIPLSDYLAKESERILTAVFLSFLIPAIIALAFNAIYRRVRKVPRNGPYPSEGRLNAFLFLFDIIFVAPIITAITALIYKAVDGASLLNQHHFDAIPSVIVLIAAIFIGDFVSYFRHRWEHSRILWPTHAIHHSDEAMTWLTIYRFHPLNRLTTAIIDSSALIVLGFPVWAIVANNLVRHFYGMFIHADLPWTYGFMGRIFVSPAMHRWHHVLEGRGIYSNYATVFSIFDQVFRTFYVPGPCNKELGISQSIKLDVGAQLIFPFKEWARPWLTLRRKAH